MTDPRAAIALLATVCATLTGCVTVPTRGSPRTPSTKIGANEPGTRKVEKFTIVFATFIPNNHLLGPFIHPQSYRGVAPPMRLAFAGDDRGFNVNATTFRAKQIVTVIPDEADDSDGLLEGSRRNLGGLSESFLALPALADGRIDDRDRYGTSDGCRIKHDEVRVDTDGMIIDDPVRLGPHSVRIRLRTAARGGPQRAGYGLGPRSIGTLVSRLTLLDQRRSTRSPGHGMDTLRRSFTSIINLFSRLLPGTDQPAIS